MRARSTSPSGSGTRSCASSASGSPSRTTRCSTRRDGIPWAKWFTGGTLQPRRRRASTAGPTIRDADGAAVVWEGEDGDDPHAHAAPSCARSTDRIASGLAARGVGAGDAVGLFLPMVPETVAALLAVAKLGAIFLPIFSGYGADAVAVRLEDAGAVALITADGFTRRGKVVADEGDRRRRGRAGADACTRSSSCRASVAPTCRCTPGRDLTLAELDATRRRSRSTRVAVDSEHPLFVAYTSGTTGRPKGAVHVHGGFLVKIAEEVAFQIDLRAGRAAVLAHRHRLDHGAVGDRRHARQRRHARAATTARPTIPGPTGCGRSSSATASTSSACRPTLIRALMAHGDEPVARARPVVAAHPRLDRRAVERGAVALVLRRRRRRPLPGHQHLRRHRGRRVLPVAARRRSRSSPCSLGGPALGMAVDVFDDDGHPVRGEVGELVCTKPWPGMTRGSVPRSASATSRRTGRAGPDVWWHGDFASVDRRRPVVPARPLRRHDQARGQAARAGRGRDGASSAHPAVRRGRRGRRARRAEGRGAVGVRRARARASTPTTRCAPSSSRVRRRRTSARRSSPPQVRFTTRAAEDAQRQGAAPRDPRGRRPATRPATCPASKIPATLDAIAASALTMSRARRARVSCCGRCGPTTGTRGARCGMRCRDWLERWEPRARAGQRRPGARPRGVPRPVRRVGAPAPLRRRVRLRAVPRRRPVRGRGQPRQRAAGPFQMGYVGYWIDEALAGHGYVPEGVVLLIRFAFETLQLHRLEAAIVPRNTREPAGGREARPPRRGHRAALPPDPGRLRGPRPLRDHRRGVARRAATSSSPATVAPDAPRHLALGCVEPALASSDHAWCSTSVGDRGARSSVATAPARSVCFDACAEQRLGDLGGARAEGASGGRAARRRDGTPTRGRSRPRAAPSTRSPNSTIAAAACGPTARSSIQVWPPPGWRPSCRNRVSKRADVAGEPHVAREREVHARADRGAVHRGDGRQRRPQHAQEALVDRRRPAALAVVCARATARRGCDDVGAGAERGRLAGDDDRADGRRRPRARRTSRRSRRPSARSARCAARGRRA